MKKLLLGLLMALGLSTAHAQDVDLRNLQTVPLGELGIYNLDTQISLQSTYGLSVLRDVVDTTGGSVTLESGYLRVSSGASSGQDARLESVQYGQYGPGRKAAWGMGLANIQLPTGDGTLEWGIATENNGIYYRYTAANGLCLVYERASTETVRCNLLEDIDLSNNGALFIARFNWYGIGGADYYALIADEGYVDGLRRVFLGRIVPGDGEALEDPNLPIFAYASNGTAAEDVRMDVGGRRYDTLGEFDPPQQITFDSRDSESVSTSWTPLICVRRKTDYPEAGRRNTVNTSVVSIVPSVSTEPIIVGIATVDATDLTGASFASPAEFDAASVAVEYDTSSTAITNFTMIGGGFRFDPGTGNQRRLGQNSLDTAPLIRNDPTCAIAKTLSGTATVDTTMRVETRK